MVIPSNYVLIVPRTAKNNRISVPTREVRGFRGDLKSEHDYLPHCGNVVALPSQLVYHGNTIQKLKTRWSQEVPESALPQLIKLNMETLSIDTDIEIQIDDLVFFEPRVIEECIKRGELIRLSQTGDRKFDCGLLIRYDYLLCAYRDSTLYPINGNVLVTGIPKKTGALKSLGDKKNEGVVYKAAKPLRHRRVTATDKFTGFGDGEQLNRNDRVVFMNHAKRRLDSPYNPILPRNYYIMPYNHILARWENKTTRKKHT